MNITPSRSQTHPDLPQGKEQVTQPMISANEHQPPLVLPRRGDAGYLALLFPLVAMQVTSRCYFHFGTMQITLALLFPLWDDADYSC